MRFKTFYVFFLKKLNRMYLRIIFYILIIWIKFEMIDCKIYLVTIQTKSRNYIITN